MKEEFILRAGYDDDAESIIGTVIVEMPDTKDSKKFMKVIKEGSGVILPQVLKNLETNEYKLLGFNLVPNNMPEDAGKEDST